jgi:hypothetical protein
MGKIVKDHKDNKFSSIRVMCEAWGITYEDYQIRRTKHWDLKDVFETPTGEELPKSKINTIVTKVAEIDNLPDIQDILPADLIKTLKSVSVYDFFMALEIVKKAA